MRVHMGVHKISSADREVHEISSAETTFTIHPRTPFLFSSAFPQRPYDYLRPRAPVLTISSADGFRDEFWEYTLSTSLFGYSYFNIIFNKLLRDKLFRRSVRIF